MQATDHLAVNLRLTGTRTNTAPAQQIIQVTRGQRLQQLGGNRQTQLADRQHGAARQRQSTGHITAAVELRIVQHALPANGSARLFNVGTHHQQQAVRNAALQLSQALGVFDCSIGVMQGTGPGDHQQAIILARQDVTNGLAVGLNGGGLSGSQRQTLAQLSRRRQGVGAAGGALSGRCGAGECSYGGGHLLLP